MRVSWHTDPSFAVALEVALGKPSFCVYVDVSVSDVDAWIGRITDLRLMPFRTHVRRFPTKETLFARFLCVGDFFLSHVNAKVRRPVARSAVPLGRLGLTIVEPPLTTTTRLQNSTACVRFKEIINVPLSLFESAPVCTRLHLSAPVPMSSTTTGMYSSPPRISEGLSPHFLDGIDNELFL